MNAWVDSNKVVVLVVVLCAAACTARADESSNETKLSRCEAPSGDELEHTCLHAVAGPFRNVTAVAEASEDVADISRPHTFYRVTLPALPGATNAAGYRGVTTFVPRETGDYALYTSAEDPDVAVRSTEGHEPLEVECSTALPENTCEGALRFYRALELEEGVAYQFVWTSVGSPAIGLAIERAPDHGHPQGEEGHGHDH